VIGTIAAQTIRDQRRALIGWSAGMIGLVLLYGAFFPSIRGNAAQLERYFDNLPEAFRRAIGGGADFGTAVGYLHTELFSLLAPLLLILLSIGAGARAIAGEEERRTLDLLLAYPVRRRDIVLEKLGAMVMTTSGVGAVLWLAVVVLGPPFDLHVSLGNLAAACLAAVLLGLVFGATALFLGCLLGRRGLAIALTGAAAVVLYLVDLLAPQVEGVRWLETLSPFHYYLGPNPLVNGLPARSAALLVGLIAAFAIAAVAAFDRRDVAA
jgi:ABC-2 type transport system permease protein